MDSPKHKYEFPVPGSAWTHSVELGAGIYFLDGRTHVAGHSSAAERYLLERGALLIATLHFDRDPQEGNVPGRALDALAAREAVRTFASSLSRN